MIPLSTFNLLIAVDILFVIYSVIDHENRLYANIAIAFLAGILSAFISSIVSTSVVYSEISGVIDIVNSPSVGYLFLLISTVMFVYTVFMVYEVINEATQAKKLAMQPPEEP